MTAVLVNPNLVVQRNDPFTTGIVYMPIGLAYVAAVLRQARFPVHVIDAFGERPRQARRRGAFSILGLEPLEVAARLPDDATVAFVFANQLINHVSVVELIRTIKQARPGLPVVVMENTQAVTAYALSPVAALLTECGADYVLTGEPEPRAVAVMEAFHRGKGMEALRTIDGLHGPDFRNSPGGVIKALDSLPFPAWDLFPVRNYWSLRFAHGPQSTPRYLPMLTSRGCPFACRFCVAPATNRRLWRARSAANIVDEMEHHTRSLDVREFHIEDLNPTVDDARIRSICHEIIDRRIGVVWKLVAGTKIESIRDEETIELMAKAGCQYISFSPESGSPRVLRLMNKPFKVDHAVRLVSSMNRFGVRSQACFVLGFPGEQPEDRQMTRRLVKDLTRKGVDEIALFIMSPVPGAEIFDSLRGYQSLSELNFTPTWRDDYETLNRFRLRLYVSFLFWKARCHPGKIVRQGINFILRRFETKMEMVPYKALVLKRLDWGKRERLGRRWRGRGG